MITAVVIAVLLLGLLGWGGQLVSALAPQLAARLGLTEAEADVDATFYADGQAECIWDALSLWTLPLAALLLLLDQPAWPLLGLVGGAMYLYFSGRGLAQRMVMRRRGIAVGQPSVLKVHYLFLLLWGAAGASFIALSCLELLQRS